MIMLFNSSGHCILKQQPLKQVRFCDLSGSNMIWSQWRTPEIQCCFFLEYQYISIHKLFSENICVLLFFFFLNLWMRLREVLKVRTAKINCKTYKVFCSIFIFYSSRLKKRTFLIIDRRSVPGNSRKEANWCRIRWPFASWITDHLKQFHKHWAPNSQ